jgi:hypothetical protein
MAANSTIVCGTCGRRFAWKPNLAGRTIPCKCGAPIAVAGGAAATAAKSANIKTIITIVGVLAVIAVVLVLLSQYGSRLYPKAKSSDPVANLPGQDGWVVGQINGGNDREAEQWLKTGGTRAVISLYWTHDVMQKYVDLWYARGAKKVLAFGDGIWTSQLAIELPDAKDQRKFFFDFTDYFYGGDKYPGYLPPKDVGQQYLVIFFMNPIARTGVLP